jgi:hypothetical protein
VPDSSPACFDPFASVIVLGMVHRAFTDRQADTRPLLLPRLIRVSNSLILPVAHSSGIEDGRFSDIGNGASSVLIGFVILSVIYR